MEEPYDEWEDNLRANGVRVRSAIRGLLSSSGPLKEPKDHFFEMLHKTINLNPEEDRLLAKIRLTEVPAHYLV